MITVISDEEFGRRGIVEIFLFDLPINYFERLLTTSASRVSDQLGWMRCIPCRFDNGHYFQLQQYESGPQQGTQLVATKGILGHIDNLLQDLKIEQSQISWSDLDPGRWPVYADKSLDDLERPWPEPSEWTYVIRTSYALRKKPLGDLTAEELRLAIGQPVFQKSLRLLVPFALNHLEMDPLKEADLFPGDLLLSVLRVPNYQWEVYRDHLDRLNGILARFEELIPQQPDHWQKTCLPSIRETLATLR